MYWRFFGICIGISISLPPSIGNGICMGISLQPSIGIGLNPIGHIVVSADFIDIISAYNTIKSYQYYTDILSVSVVRMHSRVIRPLRLGHGFS